MSNSSSDMPAGPWLMVLGMHRSGTSAVTGALGALGFNTSHPDDRVDWPESNPEHWESVSLSVYDDNLLSDLGGSWEAPPDFPLNWEINAKVRRAPDPVPLVRRAYPDPGPLVWKDPRLCFLLPYWKRFLPKPLAAVLVWRSPLAVAISLQKRDGMHLADGIALWERYNRSALDHLVGLDTYVCNYEDILADPSKAVISIAHWLRSLPQFVDYSSQWSHENAAATIIEEPRSRPDDDNQLLLAQHQELIGRLTALEGGHRPLGVTPLKRESGWTTALLEARGVSRTREFQTQLKNTQLQLDRLHESTSWRMTKPLRSLMYLIKKPGL